ncbi:hypothetical protein K7X08_016664 [Anisodus acutangulus]|uniref:Uncharacterized protein n=1 Tax=Anisodus acutangulus TaxID=402998 RepID=A0A9Q1LI08_9SOLA|nr:hypothetical protein K7X08_016664 [Anisodus acutangulus]
MTPCKPLSCINSTFFHFLHRFFRFLYLLLLLSSTLINSRAISLKLMISASLDWTALPDSKSCTQLLHVLVICNSCSTLAAGSSPICSC